MKDFKCGEVKKIISHNSNPFAKEVILETKHFSCLFVIIFIILVISSLAEAESVYAVTNHSSSNVNAYLINPSGTIGIQTSVEGSTWIDERATGLCVWSEVDRLFATYEDGPTISWASTKTLTRETDDEIDAPESSLAGVVADETKDVLYVVTRYGGHLYTYSYDEIKDTLVLVHPNDPAYPNRTYRQLEGLESGYTFGLALDADGGPQILGFSTGLLYVANGTSTIRYYNTLTWELEDTVDMGRSAVGIDVNGEGYLYAGGYFGSPAHDYLIRYNFNDSDPNTALTEKDMGYMITGIVVDRDTGMLYTTTRRVVDGRTGAVEVYDPAYWDSSDPNDFIIDIESDTTFGGPAGIGVGSQYKPDNDMYIRKVDDVEDPNGYVVPSDIYTYTIAYHPGPEDEPNVVITDYLPEGVNFYSAYPDDPNWCYYTERPVHTYIWELGDVPGYDPNTWTGGDPNYYFELTVQVNTHAEPMGILYNKVSAESDNSYVEANETTRVDCWTGDGIIYVDRYAPGAKTGIDWENAYTDLQDALERALKGCGSEIHVADGVYWPGKTEDNTFEIPDNVEVYGGYAGYGASDPNERDWKKYKTVLSGYVNETTKNNSVVTMGDDSLLNGVTVEKGGYYGIFSNGDDFSIKNSLIENNYQKGIYCNNGNLTVEWCEIRNNEQQGIHHIGSGFSLSINNCNIHNNFRDGILTEYSMLELRNSVIYENGTSGSYFGINTNNSGSNSEIRNNTIVHNFSEGIRHAGTNQPDVRNNILWHNNMQDELQKQLVGISARYYNCIYDPNDPQGSSTPDANGNITADPNFAYSYPVYGYYHINSGSPCRDMGDPDEQNYVQADEVDMDGDDRDLDGNVDMGADEVACEDTSNPIDWNGDGIINLKEFSILSSAWLTQDPNSPSYPNPNNPDPNDVYAWYVLDAGPKADLNQDSYVDLYDLIEFCEDSPQGWLWQACWHENYVEMMRMGIDSSIAAPPMSLSLPASKIIQSKSVYREPDPETMEKTILEILDYVDLRIQEKDENIEGLYDMKIFLEECLVNIQNDKQWTSF